MKKFQIKRKWKTTKSLSKTSSWRFSFRNGSTSRAFPLRKACRACWKRIRIGSRAGSAACNREIHRKCVRTRIRQCWPRTSQRCCRAPPEQSKTRSTAAKWSKKKVDSSSCHLGKKLLCSSLLTTCNCKHRTPCMKKWTQTGPLPGPSMKIVSRLKGEHRLGHHWLHPLVVPPSLKIIPPCITCKARNKPTRSFTYLKSRVVYLTLAAWQPLLQQTSYCSKYLRRQRTAWLRKITR